jgi:hypothetical protein
MDFLFDGDRRYLPLENGYFIPGGVALSFEAAECLLHKRKNNFVYFSAAQATFLSCNLTKP